MRAFSAVLAVLLLCTTVASAAVIYVPGDYGTIQAAINAASDDDIIVVAAGTYREQLKIDGKDLTISGAGIGSTIVEAVDIGSRTTYSITQWTGDPRTIDACIGVVGPCDVTIEDLTVDGRSLGPDNFYGIHIFNADATVTDCRIEDVLYGAGPSASRVVSLAATHGTGTETYAVALSGNEIPNFQKGGIVIMGPRLSFAVEENEIVNAPSPALAGNGMQLSYGATGTTSRNVVSGVAYSGEDWSATGILLFENGDVSMSGDVVHDCQTGIGYSNWHWIYSAPGVVDVTVDGAELYENGWALSAHLAADNADLDFRADGCYLHDNEYDGVDLYGTDEDPWGGSYYAGWSNGDLVAEITDCLFTGSGYDGIWTSDSSGNTNNTAVIDVHGCSFVGNAEAGIWNNLTHTIDAENCWWNDPAGPTVLTLRGTADSRPGAPPVSPYGGELPALGAPASVAASIGRSGDGIYGPVDASPFLSGDIFCDPDPEYLTEAEPTKTIAVKYAGGGGGLLYGYSIEFSWDTGVVSTDDTKVLEGSLLSSAGTTFFYATEITPGEITVDCALLGAVDGVTGPGTMFTIEFTGEDLGTSPVDLTILSVRDRYNNPLTGYFADDGLLVVDIVDPTVVSVHISNEEPDVTDDWVKNGDSVKLVAYVTDDDPTFDEDNIWANLTGLDRVGDVHPDSYTWATGEAVWNAWVADPTVPQNGTVTVTVYAEDPIGNTDSGTDDIEADNIAPAAATGFDASPAHQECVLAWTNGYDLNWAGVTVRRLGDGEYPTYPYLVANWPGVDAHYPADETAGTEAYNGTGTGVTDGVVTRDIYYYQAFGYDHARNYGPAAAGARDLSTNYWLGDIAAAVGVWGYNGLVNDADIDKLGGTYHVSGPGALDEECDVGPTVHPDYSRVGLPKPDDLVGFEDLMIFAMNYGVVVPRIVPLLPGLANEALALSLVEISSRGDEVQVALRLDGNTGEVKGVSAAVALDPTELEFVSAGLMPEMQTPLARMFFWSGLEDGTVLVDLAVLGTGVSIGGSGDVAVLTFRALTDEYTLEFDSATLRGVDNEELAANLEGCVSRPGNPTAFRLVQNVPNPFNPKTTVAYEVPQSSQVTIRVYDVAGKLVRTLVDGTVEPGRYAATWDGRNDAGGTVGSGVYFCTMQTPAYNATHKMVLMK